MDYSMMMLLMFVIFGGGVIAGVIMFVHMANLSQQVKTLASRVAAIESRPAQTPETKPEAEHPERPAEAQQEPTPLLPSGPPPKLPPERPISAPPFELKRPDWNIETLIGGKWLNRIGVILIIFGFGFFLKLAFDNDWIGETGRVAIGFLAGFMLIVFGEWYRRKDYRYFSHGITGGGIAILYLSIYAAFGFYHLITQGPAFGLMICVTAASVFLAVWNGALPIASLATVGGFMTPVILSTGVDNQVVLFSYFFILNAGILAIAYFKNWPSLNYQSFVFTVIAFSTWAGKFYGPEKLEPTAFFLTIFFILFALLAILHNIVNRRKASPPELILALANAALYFGAMYFLLDKEYGDYLGLFALAVGAAYVGLAYLTNVRHGEDRLLVWIFLGLAATFVTLAIPIQLKQNWITVGWAIEGAILAYIAYRYDSKNTRLAVLAILVLVFFRLIFFDLRLPYNYVGGNFVLLFNRRVFSYIVGIAAMGFSAYFFSRDKNQAPALFSDKNIITAGLLIASNLLVIILLSAEAYDFLKHLDLQGRIQPNTYRYAHQLSLSIIWGAYGVALLVTGIRKNHKPLRYMALALFAITTVKVFAVDMSELKDVYKVLSAIGYGAILIGVSLLYSKYKDVLLGPQPETPETGDNAVEPDGGNTK